MTWELHRHDARRVSDIVAPESVDLIVTSPPYFALRSYRDECEACGGDGQWRDGVEARPAPTLQPPSAKSTLKHDGRKNPQPVGGYERGAYEAGPRLDSCPACNGSGRAHYDGQLGSEATPGEFVDNLIACTADWLKVLKPTGSLFVNLGDKYAGSGGHNNNGLGTSTLGHHKGGGGPHSERIQATRRNAPDRYNQASDGIPPKSRMGLPWRYAIRCIDELGLILRADIIWEKPNHLPESVTDRVRMSHEYLFHFTRQGRYFAAIDEAREPASSPIHIAAKYSTRRQGQTDATRGTLPYQNDAPNPLGKAPGSVWQIPSEPLQVPDHVGVDHFAAYPSELVRRCVLGWTPSGWCTVCGEARRPVVVQTSEAYAAERARVQAAGVQTAHEWGAIDTGRKGIGRTTAGGYSDISNGVVRPEHTITGYACACVGTCRTCSGNGCNPDVCVGPSCRDERHAACSECHGSGLGPTTDAPTTPAVVLDPFCGTGTTVLVADQLGRHGIGVDLSADYLRLAEWRVRHDTHTHRKVRDRSGLATPQPPKVDGQLGLFEEPA